MTRKDFLFLKEKLSYQFQMNLKLFFVYLSVLFSGELAQAENKSKKIKGDFPRVKKVAELISNSQLPLVIPIKKYHKRR